MKVQLQEVFGIGRDIPKYTYVDRANLDQRFTYLLKTQRHVVVHGASKQGKSCLRKKNLNEENSIVIQCLPVMETTKDLWTAAFRGLNIGFPQLSEKSSLVEVESGIIASGGANVKVLKTDLSVSGALSTKNESTQTNINAEGFDEDLRFLAENLLRVKKRLVLEDFHYLKEELRKKVAFSLKALYELGIYVIIIGIWAEQNLMTYYNGDLTGRIEEVNLVWDRSELIELISKGETALNISFSEEVKRMMVGSSFQNVGLLQRIAEKTCIRKGIFEQSSEKVIIDDPNLITDARSDLISDIQQRYQKIYDVFKNGFRTNTELRVYYNIFRVLATELSTDELITGVQVGKIFDAINKVTGKTIRQSDLTSALDRIERLQSEKGVTPLLISYNRRLHTLSLIDREFLFFRTYGNQNFDWTEGDEQ